MVFSTNFNKISLTKKFLDGKTTYGNNLYVNLYSQIDSIVFIGRSSLTTNNIKSSKRPICVASFFLNLLLKETRNYSWRYMCLLFLGSWSRRNLRALLPSFNNFFNKVEWLILTWFFMVVMPLDLWYAMKKKLHLVHIAKISSGIVSSWQIIHFIIWFWERSIGWLLSTLKNAYIGEL
jgi:hypothetical protein